MSQKEFILLLGVTIFAICAGVSLIILSIAAI